MSNSLFKKKTNNTIEVSYGKVSFLIVTWSDFAAIKEVVKTQNVKSILRCSKTVFDVNDVDVKVLEYIND